MFQEVINLIAANKRVRLGLITAAGLVLLIGLIATLWPRTNYPQYQVGRTGLNSQQSFGHLVGSKLFGYNGMAFFSIDTKANNQMTVLSQPGKLPAPNAIYWANANGVLMSFSGSFSLTRIEDELIRRGMIVDAETQLYTWYLNFKDNSLHLVYPGLILPNLATYSATDKGFYFMPEQPSLGDVAGDDPLRPSSDVESRKAVYFFNTETKKVTALTEEIEAVNVSYIQECRIKGQRVCLIARGEADQTKQFVYGINAQGKATTLLQTSGLLAPTNQQHLFITAEMGTKPGDNEETHAHEEGDIETVDFEPSPAILHDLASNTKIDLGFDIASEDIVANIQGDAFYVYDATTATDKVIGGYHSGKLSGQQADSQHRQLLVDDKPYESGFSGPVSYGDNGLSLMSGATNTQFLLAPKEVNASVKLLSPTEAEKKVTACVKQTAASHQYFQEEHQFRVFFSGEQDLGRKIQSFNNCQLKSLGNDVTGYTYYYGTQDPVNGRITSD